MRLTSSLAIIGSCQFGLSGPFDCHVYAVRGPGGIVLIDAGAGTNNENLLANLTSDLGTQTIEGLVLTHSHIDHCGGAAAFRASAHCRVFASQATQRILEAGDEVASGLEVARNQGAYPRSLHLHPCIVDQPLEDGQEFHASGIHFKALQIRGHSPDSFCYWTRSMGESWVFVGDAVFYGGVLGVINADGSGMDGYRTDLQKLSGLSVEGFFPGHGLMALRRGQRHIDEAIRQVQKGFLPRQIGQGDAIF